MIKEQIILKDFGASGTVEEVLAYLKDVQINSHQQKVIGIISFKDTRGHDVLNIECLCRPTQEIKNDIHILFHKPFSN